VLPPLPVEPEALLDPELPVAPAPPVVDSPPLAEWPPLELLLSEPELVPWVEAPLPVEAPAFASPPLELAAMFSPPCAGGFSSGQPRQRDSAAVAAASSHPFFRVVRTEASVHRSSALSITPQGESAPRRRTDYSGKLVDRSRFCEHSG
jgi:hypothetical protein